MTTFKTNEMNELTKKLQQVMVPKAALIAYEYSDGRYGHGTYYLELHPINDRGRMEAAVPVTYEFMDSLAVVRYTQGTREVHLVQSSGKTADVLFRKAEYSGRDIPCTRCHLQGFR